MAGNTVLKPELTPFHINRRELPLCGSSAKAAAAPSRMSIPWQPVAHLSLPFRQLPLGSEGQGRRAGPQISGTTSGSRQALDGIGVFTCSNNPPLCPSPPPTSAWSCGNQLAGHSRWAECSPCPRSLCPAPGPPGKWTQIISTLSFNRQLKYAFCR